MALRALVFAFIVVGCSAGSSSPPVTEEPSAAAGETAPPPDAHDGGNATAAIDSSIIADASPSNDATTIGNDAGVAASCTPIFAKGTACSDCINDECTTELASCNGDCDCLAANACDGDCLVKIPATDYAALQACMDVCKAQHPAGSAKFLTLAKCSYARCSASSDGGTGACP